MTIRVALNHRTTYRYDRLTVIHPQIVRLRPAPHCRTPILSYSLRIEPSEHFINWQQDPNGNFLARLVFPKPTEKLQIEVDLVADMTVINPFDFFVEDSVKHVPFSYDTWLSRELKPYLETAAAGPKFDAYVADLRALLASSEELKTVDFLVRVNQELQQHIGYTIRLEPGVQSPEQTLELRTGSCRDTSWLLVQLLRHIGLAARFVSGYLIQLAPDLKPIEGPEGPTSDFTDLHAWAEVYLPGAGWIGLDPTSGLLTGEGHIPLAATPDPVSAAPITGSTSKAEVDFDFSMSITRIHEDPRVTKPYTSDQWQRIEGLGHAVDKRLNEHDVRLTMGGEPTFVSIDDMQSPEWNTAAVGHKKRELSEQLIKRLRETFSVGGMLHYGQGKWYPGESLPRWSLACYWRKDGVPIWHDPNLIADTSQPGNLDPVDAKLFVTQLAKILEVPTKYIRPAYEDAAYFLVKEQRLPVNVDPKDPKLADPEERARMARVFEQGVGQEVGFVLPLRRQWWQAKPRWMSGPWPVRADKLFLLPGDSPIGLRLPLDALPYSASGPIDPLIVSYPMAPVGPLPQPLYRQQTFIASEQASVAAQTISEQYLVPHGGSGAANSAYGQQAGLAHFGPRVPPRFRFKMADWLAGEQPPESVAAEYVVRTALCVEVRKGQLHVFMPPVERIDDYLDLVAAVEETARQLEVAIILEGYHPPYDPRVAVMKVTPDPGVIEVNTHPSASWDELVQSTKQLYEQARFTRLGTEKFDLDGKHTGTGGGNHLVLGGAYPTDSPFLRRPDLLKSLLGYWINHPALSYLFSGRFIGPTSQAPRVDEGRRDALYELELAFTQIPRAGESCPPWLVDRVFRNLLTDLTGNTHRAEFCIDKLFSPDSPTGRLGLVEFRGFEMPPHAEMSLTQQLLIRAMVLAFWEQAYEEPLVEWGTSLHDRFMLPYFVWDDFQYVISDLNRRGIPLELDWFKPHFEFRFPMIGEFNCDDVQITLRSAIEPWYVLGEEATGGGTARYVDSSVERLEVRVRGLVNSKHVLSCNGRRLPLHPTGAMGEYVCGLRYRAWQPPSCLHPNIPVHTPLVFDVLDAWAGRSLGGCAYHVAHPGGSNYTDFPINANSAEARRASRFFKMGHTPGFVRIPLKETNASFPLTLDLRRAPRFE